VDRATESAEMIHEGLNSQGVESHMKGVFMKINYQDKMFDYIRDIHNAGAPNARPYFLNHVREHYPPWEVEPGLMIAKRNAAIMMENLRSATPTSFDIYVSHDLYCAFFLFYWFGIMPDERWIEFLDGFITQQTEHKLFVYTKDGKKEVYHPYWWTF
jgi:hypothetical protein